MYLDYLVSVRADEELARKHGQRVTSKSIDEIRADFERIFEVSIYEDFL